jgi:hypothetical protein
MPLDAIVSSLKIIAVLKEHAKQFHIFDTGDVPLL